tara:strand:+ start:155 stop:2572 length:2418 start_codon:yes stop_codon:yes gene_type:complete
MALFDTIRAGSSGATDFEIERSLRFFKGESTKLTRTFGTNTSNTTKTISCWYKRDNLGVYQSLFSTTVNGFIEGRLQFDDSDRLQFTDRDAGSGSSDANKISTRFLRDPGAWYHIVLALDSTDSTASDRIKIYVNGTRITNFDTDANPSSSYAFSFFRSSADNYIGVNNSSSDFLCGNLAEIHFIDGQALTPSSFAETDTATGQWKPIKYTGTYGNNGFHLNFSDNSSTSALGTDSSGNGNNFTTTNFSVSGLTNDSIPDTPSNNFCTLNQLNASNSFNFGNSEGGLVFDQTSNDQAITGTFFISPQISGKWYWEIYKNSGQNPEIGICGQETLSNQSTGIVNRVAFITNGGNLRTGTSSNQSITGGSAQTGAGYIRIACDMDNKKIWFSDLSGNYFNSGNPATGANAAYDFSSHEVANGWAPYIFMGTGNDHNCIANFGQLDVNSFSSNIPAGFKTLCSDNLPACTAVPSGNYNNTVIYTGNRTARSITGVGFQPDWIWIKDLGGSQNPQMFDAVRGANVGIRPDGTGGDITGHTNTLTSFDSDGFSLGNDANVGDVNYDLQDHAAWCWYAGGSTVTNSTGSISAQVRADTNSGLSICTWTGNGSSGSTIGHGLGVTPNFCFIKRRDTSGHNWIAGSFDEESARELNTGNGFSAGDYDAFFPSQPSSTVVTLSNNDNCNASSATYVGYFFANTDGYSKAGLYSGSGGSNGAFVYTGFRPSWVIYKRFDTSDDGWYIQDSVRSPENVTKVSSRNAATPQSGENIGDMLSNGFKIRIGGNGNFNASGGTYIYLAFAEAPYKFARAR